MKPIRLLCRLLSRSSLWLNHLLARFHRRNRNAVNFTVERWQPRPHRWRAWLNGGGGAASDCVSVVVKFCRLSRCLVDDTFVNAAACGSMWVVLVSAHTVLVATAAFLLMAPECGYQGYNSCRQFWGRGCCRLGKHDAYSPAELPHSAGLTFSGIIGRLYLWRSKLVRLASVIAHHSTML